MNSANEFAEIHFGRREVFKFAYEVLNFYRCEKIDYINLGYSKRFLIQQIGFYTSLIMRMSAVLESLLHFEEKFHVRDSFSLIRES